MMLPIASSARRIGVATAIAFAAVVAALGMWRLAPEDVTADPSPSGFAMPSGSPTPDATSSAWRTVPFADLGFALTFPENWTSAAWSDGVLLLSPKGDRFRVQLADPGGTIDVCADAGCTPQPADSLDGLAALAEAIYRANWSLPPERVTVKVSESRLDMEAAVVVQVSPRRPQIGPGGTTTYIGAIHGSRSYLVASEAETGRVSRYLGRVLDGFRFVDSGVRDLEVHAFPDAGFRIDLPVDWKIDETGPKRMRASSVSGSLTVEIGDPDGGLRLCMNVLDLAASCDDRTVVTSLSNLKVQAEGRMGSACFQEGCGVHTSVTSIGGDDGIQFRLRAGGGQRVVYLMAMHGNRPYYLRFFSTVFLNPVWGQMADSFRWLDANGVGPTGSSATWKVHSFPEADVSIELPTDWIVETHAAVRLLASHGEESVTLHLGDPVLGVRLCLDATSATPVCGGLKAPSSLEALRQVVDAELSSVCSYGACRIEAMNFAPVTTARIAGDEAIRLVLVVRDHGSAVYYFAFHGNRLYYLRFYTPVQLMGPLGPSLGAVNPAGDRILASVRFADQP
jgi:hypothetical protein